MRMDMPWDWPCGVAYYGVCRAYEATGQQKYLDMVRARVDEALPWWKRWVFRLLGPAL